jgi:hypothetical protein
MNFYYSQLEIAYNLKQYKTKNNWFLYLDEGWTVTDEFAYKGIDASWCRLDYKDNVKVTTNKLRDFPIYYHDTQVSNFSNHTPLLPVDGSLVWNNNKVEVNWDKEFYPKLPKKQLTFEQSSNILFESICENVEQFAKSNAKPVCVPKQNGIDTLTARSVLDYLKVKYELFDLPNEKPKLSQIGEQVASKHWGFNQIQEIPNSVVVTGFYGDEWILRNPYYVHMLLSQRNKNITEIFDSINTCYMKKYFENYRKKCSVKITNENTIKDLTLMICNDFQIWHLNTTYFFSPLKHINLLNLLNADNDTIINQVTEAQLSKSVIEKCNPELLKELHTIKNQTDPEYFWP